MNIFPDAIMQALIGYAVVFFGLALLQLVVVIMGKAMTVKAAAPAASAAKAAVPATQAPTAKTGAVAPGSAGEIMLRGVDDRTAAMLMAIVADKMGKPLNELRFISIKEVK